MKEPQGGESERAHTGEHRGLVVGAAGMMAAGFLTTFLSPLLAVSFAREFHFGIHRRVCWWRADKAGSPYPHSEFCPRCRVWIDARSGSLEHFSPRRVFR